MSGRTFAASKAEAVASSFDPVTALMGFITRPKYTIHTQCQKKNVPPAAPQKKLTRRLSSCRVGAMKIGDLIYFSLIGNSYFKDRSPIGCGTITGIKGWSLKIKLEQDFLSLLAGTSIRISPDEIVDKPT